MLRASAKSSSCGGSSVCRDEGAKNKCVAHKGCIDRGKARGGPCTSMAAAHTKAVGFRQCRSTGRA